MSTIASSPCPQYPLPLPMSIICTLCSQEAVLGSQNGSAIVRKSVFSRGLKFVPISKKADEFSVKQDLEKFLRRVQLIAFFHDKEDDSNTSNKDTFETLQIRKSKWTPPEGKYASLDFSIKKCRHSINKSKFSPSSLLELRVFTFYLKSTNLTTQVDPSCLSAVVPPNLFPAT